MRNSLNGFRVSCFAICTTTLWCGFLLLNDSALDRDFRPIIAVLAKMGTGSRCQGSPFRSPKNTLQLYQSIMGVPRSILTAGFSTIMNQTFTCKFPICTNKRMVSSRVTHSSIALRSFGVEWLFTLHFHSPWISLQLMMGSWSYMVEIDVWLTFVGRIDLTTYFISSFLEKRHDWRRDSKITLLDEGSLGE